MHYKRFPAKDKELDAESRLEIKEFLSKVHMMILSMRRTEGEKYSILSLVLNCFYESKNTILSKNEIFQYIRQDIKINRNKMVTSFVINGTNSKEVIHEENYQRKTQGILIKNKCLIQLGNDMFCLNLNFIKSHKSLLFKNIFGKDLYSDTRQKRKKSKSNLDMTSATIKSGNNPRRYMSKALSAEKSADDFDIEIIGSEHEDTKLMEKKRYEDTECSLKEETSKIERILNKKRNRGRIDSDRETIDDIIMKNKKIKLETSIRSQIVTPSPKDREFTKNTPTKKQNLKNFEITAGKEITSILDNGKDFLSLFDNEDILKELSQIGDNDDDNDDYVKNLLKTYQKRDNTLKKYLTLLDTDYAEYQRCLESLSKYRHTLYDKFTTPTNIIGNMNKIIVGKEKCNLIIDKIIIKLKQLILEFNFIKKIICAFHENDNVKNVIDKFKDVIRNDLNKKEKEDYFNNLRINLKAGINKVLVDDKKFIEEDE